jgi:Rod binding domain-containing protein
MTNLASLLPLSLPTVDRAESLAASVSSGAPTPASAANDFESLFIAMLLKEMRQTTEGEGLFGGEASDTYGGLFDLYMSQHLANAGGLGLSRLIEAYLETSKQP